MNKRKFDSCQREYDNMTPIDDPFEDMTDEEIEYAKELESESRYERQMDDRS